MLIVGKAGASKNEKRFASSNQNVLEPEGFSDTHKLPPGQDIHNVHV